MKTKRKPKKPTKKSVEKQCLILWSLCVRARDRTCRLCGSDYKLTAHHIRSRVNKATLLDLDNGACICFRCHSLQKFNPERFLDKIIDLIGDQEYQRLKVKSQIIWKPDVYELMLMKTSLKMSLDVLRIEYGFTVDDAEIVDETGI